MSSLPPQQIFSTAFLERGRSDVVKIECVVLKIPEFTIVFESAHGKRRQGIWLRASGGILVNDISFPSVDLWYDSAPSRIVCQSLGPKHTLHLYNIWERNGVRRSLSYSSGMIVESTSIGRRYRCNDVGFETNFECVVFQLEGKFA
jgi:hypothetical protein